MDPEDDLELDDESEDLLSFGLASAAPGVVATAAPTPNATARTPTRTIAPLPTDAAGLRCCLLMAQSHPLAPSERARRGLFICNGLNPCRASQLANHPQVVRYPTVM